MLMTHLGAFIAFILMLVLLVIFYAVVSRINRDDEREEEVIGDMVDIKQFFQKWED